MSKTQRCDSVKVKFGLSGDWIPYELGCNLEEELVKVNAKLDKLQNPDSCYKCGKPYQMTPICCECGTLPIVADDLSELSLLRRQKANGELVALKTVYEWLGVSVQFECCSLKQFAVEQQLNKNTSKKLTSLMECERVIPDESYQK
jgi:hypothetical protein